MRKIHIECFEQIPCNPCVSSCPVGAIHMDTLTSCPETDQEKCIGCGNCVAACPGQACFLLDEDFSETEATLDFPYEFLPVPTEGEIVQAVDRSGSNVCEAKVIKINELEKYNHTKVIRIAFPKKYMDEVRFIRIKERETNEEI